VTWYFEGGDFYVGLQTNCGVTQLLLYCVPVVEGSRVRVILLRGGG